MCESINLTRSFIYSILQYLPAPQPPRNVVVSLDSGGVTYVHWDEPVGADYSLIGYDVRYQKIGLGDCDQSTDAPRGSLVEASTTSYALSVLEGWTKYSVSVSSYNRAGTSEPSQTNYTTPEIGK